MNDFKSLVTEYGRSIIKSAIDHEPEEAETLKTNIITAKEKIIVKHKTVENELQIAENEIHKLRTSVIDWKGKYNESSQTVKKDSTRIEDLEKKLKGQDEQGERWADMWRSERVKRRALEVELADLKEDKKRKRDSVAAVWEQAESIKLN